MVTAVARSRGVARVDNKTGTRTRRDEREGTVHQGEVIFYLSPSPPLLCIDDILKLKIAANDVDIEPHTTSDEFNLERFFNLWHL